MSPIRKGSRRPMRPYHPSEHKRPLAEIKADLRRMLTEQLIAANKRLEGFTPTE